MWAPRGRGDGRQSAAGVLRGGSEGHVETPGRRLMPSTAGRQRTPGLMVGPAGRHVGGTASAPACASLAGEGEQEASGPSEHLPDALPRHVNPGALADPGGDSAAGACSSCGRVLKGLADRGRAGGRRRAKRIR